MSWPLFIAVFGGIAFGYYLIVSVFEALTGRAILRRRRWVPTPTSAAQVRSQAYQGIGVSVGAAVLIVVFLYATSR